MRAFFWHLASLKWWLGCFNSDEWLVDGLYFSRVSYCGVLGFANGFRQWNIQIELLLISCHYFYINVTTHFIAMSVFH